MPVTSCRPCLHHTAHASFGILSSISTHGFFMHSRARPKCAEHSSRCQSASSITAPSLTTTNSFTESVTDSTSLDEALLKDDRTDYLTARRQAKQLAGLLNTIDARLRQLHTSGLPPAPSKSELALLLAACHR